MKPLLKERAIVKAIDQNLQVVHFYWPDYDLSTSFSLSKIEELFEFPILNKTYLFQFERPTNREGISYPVISVSS